MKDSTAARIVSTALSLRRDYPLATALEVLDMAFEGMHRAQLDFTDRNLPHGDHTDPREPFGQLLAAAVDDAMSPEAWVNLLATAEDPAPLLDWWRGTAIGVKFAERYSLLNTHSPLASSTPLPVAPGNQFDRE